MGPVRPACRIDAARFPPHQAPMHIRPYRPSDLSTLFAINQASTPGVGHEDRAEGLGKLIDMGTCLVAADAKDAPQGFINLITPGTMAYPSDNLRWVEDWMAREDVTAHYVDRIAIAPEARGARLGEALYNAAFEAASGRAYLTCEVNTDPDNPGSHRFHQRLGFTEIGAHRYRPDYAVRFYARALKDAGTGRS